MKGLELFKAAFKDHHKCMIVIGGTACEDYFENQGLKFRSTSDIDIILVVELIDDEFLKYFWQFIQDGGYEVWQSEEGEKKYYRFMQPKKTDLINFVAFLKDEQPDVRGLLKAMGISADLTCIDLLSQIENVFQLNSEPVDLD
jgi:hypothetical protein